MAMTRAKASQVTAKLAATGSTVRGLDDKLAEFVSVKDFGAVGDGVADDTAAIQAAIDAVAAGGEVRFPVGTFKITSTLSITKSISLVGEGGRENYDNSWDNGGGSRIHYTSLSGNAISIIPPAVGNSRIKVKLANFVVRGARVSPGAATSGRGIFVDGRQEPGTAVHLDVENVYVAQAKDEGWYITGAVYGGNLRNIGAYNCGKNGIRVATSGVDPIGEMVWSTVRCFQNGADGSSNERAGVWMLPGASNTVLIGLSCSENLGAGAVLQGGSFVGVGWQFESNQGTDQLYLGSAGGGAGLTHCVIDGFACSPGASYTGTVINVSSDANNVRICGAFFGDTLSGGGKDLFVAGGGFSISGMTGSHTFTWQATDSGAFIEGSVAGTNQLTPAFSATVGSDILNVTGNDTNYTVLFDTEVFDTSSAFNPGTGVFTASKTGKYLFSGVVTIGDIAVGHDRGYIALVTSNRQYLHRIGPMQVANAFAQASFPFSFLADMDAADTASVVVNVGASTQVIDVKGGGYTWFAGHMVAG